MFGKKIILNVNRIENVFDGNGSQRTFLNFGGNELEPRLVTHDSIKRATSKVVGCRGALSWKKRLRPMGDSSPDRATRV